MFKQLALSYSYNTPTTSNGHASGALFATVFIFAAIATVIGIVAMWKVFTKAGRPGWAAIIPIYNYWVLFEISGKPGWWALTALLGFIPFVGSLVILVLYIIAMLELAKRFGKSTAFAIVGLVIFSFVGLIILGFGDAKYDASATGVPGNTPPKVSPPTAAAPKSS